MTTKMPVPTGVRLRSCQWGDCREDRKHIVTWFTIARGVLGQAQVCEAHLKALTARLNVSELEVIDDAEIK